MRYALICLAMLVLLTGCQAKSFARELEATMLVQVLGVDQRVKEITLTAAGNPETGSGGSETALLSASGENLEQAKAALRAAGEEYVALTHVAQIILGEGETAAILEMALKDTVLSQSATVWATEQGTAEALLTATGGGVKRLSSIEINAGVQPVTVLQALRDLEERGWSEVPTLKVEADKLVLGKGKTIWRTEREE